MALLILLVGRGTSYFDGAGVGLPLLVLLCWIGVGLALALVPRREVTDTPVRTDV